MAIQNINTIQNHKDLAYILDTSNKYMYESLSNLGQRYSLKGDGITSENFSIKSLLTNYTLNNDKTYIIKLSVDNNKLWIYLYDIDINNSTTTFNEVYKKEIKYTVNTVLNTDSKIQLNQKINGIDYYQENMLIYLDNLNSQNQKLNIASIGLDNNNGIIEMNIESYNINDNTLLESLKLIDLNTDKYQLYYLKHDNESNYILYNYSIEKNSINNLYTDFSYFVTYIYNNIVKEYYNEYNKLVISDIFNEIIQIGFKNNNGNTSGIEVKYNDSEYEGFYSDNADITTNNILHYIYNQYIYMYKYIFEYYCNYIYKVDNNQLNSQILYKLYETVVNTASPESYNGFDIYLPIDFNIDYYCKDTDKFYIYSNLSPIPVLYTLNNLSNDYVYEFFNSTSNNKLNNNIILAHSNIIENIILYNVSVEYNEDFEDIINNIYFKELYSTPYIEDGYWVVNGIKTTYSAKGKDAGNPNIIIVYTNNISTDNNTEIAKHNSGYTEKDYSILTSINYTDINSVIFDKKTASIELQKINNTTLTVSCNFLVPTEIPNDFKHIFENALIINLSSVYNIINTDNTVKNDIIKYLGSESFITTFWTYSNVSNEFICIQKPNTNNALTLLDISNTESIIASLVEKTVKSQEYYNNEFDSIILKGTYTTTKNEITTGSTFDSNTFKITLKNYNANEQVINQDIPNLENYNNNLMLKFNVSNNNKHNYFNDYIQKDTNVKYFNESYIYNISNYNEYYSVLPAANVPIFNFADYFTVNSNNLNRINLITLPFNVEKVDNENINTRPYYSYIGIGNDKPNELHIGSSSKPLSLYQLVDDITTDFTNTQDTISFDFEKINTYAKEITQNININKNNNVYTINVSIPCYDEINNNDSYLSINTSTWEIAHIGTSNINNIKPVKFSASDTNEPKLSNYITNSFANIYDNYIKQYTNIELKDIDTNTTIVTENINKIIYLGNNEQYDSNKLKLDKWYYVLPYNPITYCSDLIIKLRVENNVIKHIDIHCNDGKLVPFELKETGNVKK